jgi:hypothetical protein
MPVKKAPNRLVKVTVTLKTIGKNRFVVLSRDPVRVSVKKKQQVLWVAEAGDLDIRFRSTDTPWSHGNRSFEAPWGAGCTSGVANSRAVRERPYKYTVVVVNAETGECSIKDPGVVVED